MGTAPIVQLLHHCSNFYVSDRSKTRYFFRISSHQQLQTLLQKCHQDTDYNLRFRLLQNLRNYYCYFVAYTSFLEVNVMDVNHFMLSFHLSNNFFPDFPAVEHSRRVSHEISLWNFFTRNCYDFQRNDGLGFQTHNFLFDSLLSLIQ